MSTPKRQHTIPRVYLDKFADVDQRLTIWSKRRDSYLRPKPADALVRYYYYSQPVNGESNTEHSLETKFLQEIETKYPQFFDTLIDNPSKVDITLFIETIVSLRIRSAAFREAFEIGLADYVNKFRSALPKTLLPPPPEGFENIWDHAVVTIDPHRSLHAMAYYAKSYALPLAQMEYSVFETRGTSELLTSDNPIIWYETGYGQGYPLIYIQRLTKKTRAIIPISKNLALVGRLPSTGEFKINPVRQILSKRQVREINELQIACSWDEVVGTAKVPRTSWERLRKLCPRMDIQYFNPRSGEYTISNTYLDSIREKHKFNKK